MNEKLKYFKYRKDSGEVTDRQLYVVHENNSYYTGFEFSYLTENERNVVRKVFDSLPITPPPPSNSTRIDYTALGVNQAIFKKSYRTFKKSNII